MNCIENLRYISESAQSKLAFRVNYTKYDGNLRYYSENIHSKLWI